MGNWICRKRSSVQWGGEEWGSFGQDNGKLRGHGPYENDDDDHEPVSRGKTTFRPSKDELLSSSSIAQGSSTEVKIRVSKKELEQLLRKAEAEGQSVHHVIAQLMNDDDVGDHRFEAQHQRSWSPALQSIPE